MEDKHLGLLGILAFFAFLAFMGYLAWSVTKQASTLTVKDIERAREFARRLP